jgi:hypothetical protein
MAGQQQDNNDLFLYFVLALILGCALMWWLNRNAPAVRYAMMTVARAELLPISCISEEAAKVRQAIAELDPAKVTNAQVMAQLNYAGRWYAWILALFVAYLGLKSWTLSAADRFDRRLNMRSLLVNNRGKHAAIAPILNWPKNILDEPPDSGPWKVARQPIQFVAEHGLFYDVRHKDQVDRPGKKDDPAVEPIPANLLLGHDMLANPYSPVLDGQPAVFLHLKKTGTVFRGQFGPLFTDFFHMPGYMQKLSLAFLYFGSEKKKKAFTLLDEMSVSFKPPIEAGPAKWGLKYPFYTPGVPARNKPQMNTNLGTSRNEIQNLLENEGARHFTDKHNKYMHLFVLSLYQYAREKGVLATAEFIWLRPLNRNLFYLLNNYGRRVAWTEVAGPWTYYKAEDELSRIRGNTGCRTVGNEEAEFNDMIEEGVSALELAMYEEGWIEKNNLRSGVAKTHIIDD